MITIKLNINWKLELIKCIFNSVTHTCCSEDKVTAGQPSMWREDQKITTQLSGHEEEAGGNSLALKHVHYEAV